MVDPTSAQTIADQIILLERGALDRWGKGDPGGFLKLYAPDITYFDPVTRARIDGHQAMMDYYRPWVGKIHVARYEMLNPHVVADGDMALLTYNLVNYIGTPRESSRWARAGIQRPCISVVAILGRRSTRTGRSLATPRLRPCRRRPPRGWKQ